jgi:hypothetical protein
VGLAGDNIVVAWIEDAATDGTSVDAGVRIATIDGRGALAGATVFVRGAEGTTISSVALTCSATRCRAVTAAATRGSMQIDAFEVNPGAPPGPRKTLVALSGGSNADVSPSFAGPSASVLFFGDDSASGSGRVRFMSIDWTAKK